MKVTVEVVTIRTRNAGYNGTRVLTLTACAVGDHDDRHYELELPGHLARSFPVGRRLQITIKPMPG